MKRVYLEITDSCNLNCPFCTYEKGSDFLTYAQIEDCLRQIKPFCNYIYLHILGEPLLHPDIGRILDLLDKERFHLQLVSNGTLLNRYPDLLKHECLRKLSISLHSLNGLGSEQEYFQAIDRLLAENSRTIIELRFFDKGHLDETLKTYHDNLISRFKAMPSDRNDSLRIKENAYLRYGELFRWPKIDDEPLSEAGTCHGGIDMIAINAKLEVTLCCLDPKAYNRIGSLKEESLKDILETPCYLQLVNELKQHKISSELCRRCTYRLRFR